MIEFKVLQKFPSKISLTIFSSYESKDNQFCHNHQQGTKTITEILWHQAALFSS